MSVSRKDFLKVAAASGLGVFFGGAAAIPKFLQDKGARLVPVRRQSLVMGSVAKFEVIADTEEAGYEAIRKGVDVFRSLDRIFSMYRSDSEMAKLGNAAGIASIQLSQDASNVLKFAKEISRLTNGLFDVTIEPAMRRWGFRRNDEQTDEPTQKELKKLERIIGSEKMELDGEKARLTEIGMAIDMGGIAGGYALDKAIEEMKKGDVSAGFINFSGDIHCFGKPPGDESWKVHILDPKTRQPLREAVALCNQALSTSGAYQNRRKSGKHSWGHLLHPGTATPVEPVGSVTAIHRSAMYADAWSTAAYVGATPPKDVETIVI